MCACVCMPVSVYLSFQSSRAYSRQCEVYKIFNARQGVRWKRNTLYKTSNEKQCREGRDKLKEDGKRRRMRKEKNEKSKSGLREQKTMRTRRGWRKTRGAPCGNAMCSMLLVEQEKSMLF